MSQTTWFRNRILARAWLQVPVSTPHRSRCCRSQSLSLSTLSSTIRRRNSYAEKSWKISTSRPSKPFASTTARASTFVSVATDNNNNNNNISLTEQQPQQRLITSTAVPKRFVPLPFEYHQVLELRVSALTNLGMGICRTNVSNDSLTPPPPTATDGESSSGSSLSSSQRRAKKRQARRHNNKKEEPEPDYSNHEDMIENNNEDDDDESDNNDSSAMTIPTSDSAESSSDDITATTKIQNNNNSDQQRSWVVMVPRVIPGELVQVSIYRNHATYSEADLLQVLEPSPHRIVSNNTATTTTRICPLFEQGCGGCQYQHVTIEQQRLYKQHHVRDALIRIGKLDRDLVHRLVLPTLGTEDHIWGYRTKLTPHYQALPANYSASKSTTTLPSIGFQHVNNPRYILDVPACPIATPAINDELAKVRSTLHQSLQQHGKWPTKLGATLLLRQGDPEGPVTTQYKEYVTSHVHDLQFRFQAGNFFQNNPYMVPVMVDQVVAAATAPPSSPQHSDSSSSSSDNHKMTHLIDCYCGSGLFAVSCAPHLERCTGIEVNDQAVLEAKANAQLNNLDNCHFVSASAEDIFDVVQDFPRATTSVLMDPPRKGCSPQFLQQLREFAPQRIIYVSCDPTTQARDLQSLVDRYEITKVQPMDLFPQTRHIECLVVLEAKQN